MEEDPSQDPGERAGTRTPIELKVEYKHLNAFFADYTKNISRGGTFIPTDRPLAVGTDFVFKLSLPAFSEPLVLQGKVQWTVSADSETQEQPAGMGIAFVFESEGDRRRVEEVVEGLMVKSLGHRLCRSLLGKEPASNQSPT